MIKRKVISGEEQDRLNKEYSDKVFGNGVIGTNSLLSKSQYITPANQSPISASMRLSKRFITIREQED